MTLCLQQMRKLRTQEVAGLDQAQSNSWAQGPAKAAQVCSGTDADGAREGGQGVPALKTVPQGTCGEPPFWALEEGVDRGRDGQSEVDTKTERLVPSERWPSPRGPGAPPSHGWALRSGTHAA